jgi:hypothetical protein
MKIHVIDPQDEWRPLKRHLELEGNRFVGIDEADIVLTSKTQDVIKIPKVSVPIVGGYTRYQSEALKMMGYIPCSSGDTSGDLIFTRWYDFEREWHPQINVGIPLDRLMVGGLGPKIDVGYASRYIKESSIFDRPGLNGLLEALRFRGWVSIEVDSSTGGIVQLYTWAHPIGMYNILEGIPGSMSEWFMSPFGVRLTESWVVSVLISRYPFPHSLEGERVVLDGISTSTERHYWLYGPEEFKRSLSTTSTVLGIATGWDRFLARATEFMVDKLNQLNVPDIQYRTDIFDVASRIWKTARENGLVN